LSLYIAALGFGLVSASVIAIAAVGFTMQFGITNMINLAYAEVMMTSASAAYYMTRSGLNIWFGLIVGAIVGSGFSFVLNRFVYSPYKRKGTSFIGLVIVALAVSLMTANVLLAIVGPD